MYQLMVTVSVVVDDIPEAVATLCRTIGIPEPRPQHYRGGGQGIAAVFCRVHVKYAVAPTFLELVAVAPVDDTSAEAAIFPVQATVDVQGDRPVKIHATEIGMSKETMLDLSEHLTTIGVPHRFVPPGERQRFFFGGDPATAYDPSADAGLFVETIQTANLGLPDEAFRAPADIPPDAEASSMVRIIARDYLVEDLDDSLRILDRNLRWSPISVTEDETCRRAILPFSTPRSARLELVEPKASGPAFEALKQVGPGAWTIRIQVVDVEAKADDLAARGTPFTLEEGILRPTAEATLAVPFEFVEVPLGA
jgi:hypothetical protein